ncbi:alkaline phosphatase D family protein [Jatrophihabitans sp. YIM 134969]
MTSLVLGPVLRHVGATDATVWVETAGPATVAVRIGSDLHTEPTWEVAGHHYALVEVTGLEPDTSSPYQVLVDDDVVWPEASDTRPGCRIRTVSEGRRVRISFGSCRYARSAAVHGDDHYDADALDCLSAEMMARPDSEWPDYLLMLGDQVYADETTPETRERIAAKRSLELPPGAEVADFEEYTWLYHESWTDPEVRWLLATLPSSMIFDDHDVRDDWNTSHSWREDMAETSWWHERIVGGLSSYWVYQHIGNLAPADLAASEIYQQVRSHGGDAADLLRDFAVMADAEADGGKGARWSYRRELGCARLLMIDSRCGRILADGRRSMVSEDELAWITEQTSDVGPHLLIGTSLPWLLARALQDLEAWNEALCNGDAGPKWAVRGEKLRRAADLEHWAAFRRSFLELADLMRSVGRGERGDAPATVCVLSGDVHHAYVSRADLGPGLTSAVYQLTCSPLHNYVPAFVKVGFRLFWSKAMEKGLRGLLGLVHRVPDHEIAWNREGGPWFGNELMTLHLDGRDAKLVVQKSGSAHDDLTLHDVERRDLT